MQVIVGHGGEGSRRANQRAKPKRGGGGEWGETETMRASPFAACRRQQRTESNVESVGLHACTSMKDAGEAAIVQRRTCVSAFMRVCCRVGHSNLCGTGCHDNHLYDWRRERVEEEGGEGAMRDNREAKVPRRSLVDGQARSRRQHAHRSSPSAREEPTRGRRGKRKEGGGPNLSTAPPSHTHTERDRHAHAHVRTEMHFSTSALPLHPPASHPSTFPSSIPDATPSWPSSWRTCRTTSACPSAAPPSPTASHSHSSVQQQQQA